MPDYSPTSFSSALILQGDWEGGLSNVALDLMATGKSVTKVVFHAGDWIYKWQKVPTIDFDSPLEAFEGWLRNYIKQNGVDCLILYNQYRPYNQIGWDVAKELDIECLVFELGLLRPDLCSIYSRELNHFSYLASRWDDMLSEKGVPAKAEKPAQLATMSTPCKMTQFAIYYTFSRLTAKFARRYRHYKDQRSLSFRHHLMAGIRGALRFQGREKQSRFNKIFAGRWSGKYYMIPLQVHTDSQITQRSNFKSIDEFICLVADSFIKHAPTDTKLVFKVHPMDRGYEDYRGLIKSLQTKLGGRHRIFYLDRIHLPTTLDHARGCVTINSSVGLSALIHDTPTMTLGKAAYGLKGLTYQGELDQFWTQHGKADKTHVKNFVRLLKLTSQAQGTLYQRLYAAPGRCKIAWPEEFQTIFSRDTGSIKSKPNQASSNRSCSPKASKLQVQNIS